MKTLVNKLKLYLGIDKAIFFTSASSILAALGSIVSIILVLRYLTNIEQGFYYTFGSIIAIQVFFELGLNGIIVQYVAHEAANLDFKNNELVGDQKNISRLSSLLHFGMKWYIFFAILLFITLNILGFYFFHKFDTSKETINWQLPWIVLSIGTILNLIVSPLIAFLQGLGKVKEIAFSQFLQQIFKLLILWIGLYYGAKLYVLGISSFVIIFTFFLLIFKKYFKLFINIWKTKIVEKVDYRLEIFPYQWKIAISWISGYFVFQIFNPVLFATEGAIIAGQMGMTLSILNGVLSLSYSWITTKVPLFSNLIAKKNYYELDKIFNKTLSQSILINFLGLVAIFIIIFLIRYNNLNFNGKAISDRFLDYIPLFLMMFPVLLHQIVGSWGTYLRCHKKEPYMIMSIIGGTLCMISTLIFGKYFGVIGLTTGYCFITIIMFPWAYLIFKNKKNEWHQFNINQ